MNLDRDKLVKEIFADALEKATEAERAAYLAQACGNDAQLRQHVEALLQAHEKAGAFLEQAPVAPAKPGLAGGETEPAKAGTPNGPGPTVILSTPLTEKPGDRIGHYKLREKIGEGGCGVVYVAEQVEPVRRRVALKVIKLGMDTKSVIARFEAERQALALMDHPNIAKVLDAGTTETGRPYFVMELVRGIRITDYCDQNKLSTPERLDLFMQVCHAVQHAHQKGIIHRDIKPSNILVTLHDGVPVPKVIDFGIAKATEGRLTDLTVYTELHQFIGTPAYMSPEQAEMSGLDIDTRSDIYSLGVLLYELLTGKTPFDPEKLLQSGLDAMRRTIREQEPPRPSTRLSTMLDADLTAVAQRHGAEPPRLIHLIRGDLDWITMKALEKDRTRRYETANGLALDLERHLKNETIIARPPSSAYRFQKLVQRNKLAFAAAAVVSGVLILGVIASTWQAVRATRARLEAVEARNHEQGLREAAQQAQANEVQMRERAEKQELEARQRAYASDMLVAKQALDGNNLGRAQDLLNRQRPQPGQRDLRGWEWRYLWQQCHSDALFTLCQKSSEIESLAVSQDGQWLAIGQARGGISVWDLRTRQQVFQLAEGSIVYAVFSPTEPLLAFTSSAFSALGEERDTLRLWNAATRQMIGEFPLNSRCMGLAFSKDGRTLVTSTSSFATEGRITLWRIPEGTEVASYPSEQLDMTAGTSFAATPDLSLAAYALQSGKGGFVSQSGRRLCVIDLRNGKELWTATAGKEYVTAVAFSPDGKTLASAAGFAESDIRLWDVASGKEIGRLEGHGSWVSSLVFWPDGKKLASSSADQTIRIWDVASQKCLDVLRGHRLEVWRLALLPDHTTLVSGSKDGAVCFWDTSVSHSHETRITLPEPMTAWRFTPDSQSVVTSDLQGRVTRWGGRDFQQAETLFEIGTNRYPGYDLLSSDGRLLAVTTTDNVLQVWDLSRRRLWREFPSPTGTIWAQSFSDDDNKLVTWSGDDDMFREWDLNSGREIHSWGVPAEYWTIASSPDQRLWLVACYGADALFEDLVGGGGVKTNLDVQEISAGAFSPDGKLFAVASDMGYARVWETATWREVVTLRGYLLSVASVAFSGDGKRLATGGGKEALKLWDTESWQEVLTLEGQGSLFSSTTFSPDGNVIGTMNAPNPVDIVQLWRAPSWEEINAAEKSAPVPNP
jgi:WD40 repeat protein/serine/threonine protein kinase